jgi:hypothetical protein
MRREGRNGMRSRQLLVAPALALIFIAVNAGCGQLMTPGQQSAPASAQQTPLPAVHIWMIVDRFMYTKPEQLCNAPLVAEVFVGAHGEARWNTIDGKRPPIATESEIVREGYLIYTPISFSSFAPLRQHSLASDQTATLVTIGGQVGQDTYQIDGLPQPPSIGGHYVVVITPPALALVEGQTPADELLVSYVYPIDANGKVILQRAGDPNEPGPGVPQPEISVALSDLKATLARCAS